MMMSSFPNIDSTFLYFQPSLWDSLIVDCLPSAKALGYYQVSLRDKSIAQKLYLNVYGTERWRPPSFSPHLAKVPSS